MSCLFKLVFTVLISCTKKILRADTKKDIENSVKRRKLHNDTEKLKKKILL